MIDIKTADIHETALELLSDMFNKDNKTLKVEIKKNNISIYNEYKSDMFFLCKFHNATFGVNKRGQLPPKIKFTVDANDYNIELIMKGENEENIVIFYEKENPDNLILLKVT